MLNIHLPDASSSFNQTEVFLFSRDEEDIVSIGASLSAAGIKCYLYDAENPPRNKKRAMLLIDYDLFDEIGKEVYEHKVKPFHFVFSFSDKASIEKESSKVLLGHIVLPLKQEDISIMKGACTQRAFYEDRIEKMDKNKLAMEKISSLGQFAGSLVHDLNNYNTICMTAFEGLKLVNMNKYQDEKIDFLLNKGLKGCTMINSLSVKYRRFMFVNEKKERANKNSRHGK